MIVCVCRRISDREVARQAGAGLGFEAIQFELGVAPQCGECEACPRDKVAQCGTCPTAHSTLASNLLEGSAWQTLCTISELSLQPSPHAP